MTPDNSPGILGWAKDRFLGTEKPGGPVEIVLPSSPHFKQYYTYRFFAALGFEDPAGSTTVQLLTEDLIRRVESPILNTHRTTNEPATDSAGEFKVSIERAETIARDYLRELLNPSKTPRVQAERTILITSLDLLLASYFGKKDFRGLVFDGKVVSKDGRLQPICSELALTSEGSKFQILSDKRSVNVTLMPMPEEDGSFKSPRFCLIGPQETGKQEGFRKVLDRSRKEAKRVVFEAKRNQLELSIAFLAQYQPARMIVTEEGTQDYKIREDNRWAYSDSLPRQKKGNLEFLVSIRAGNVDGYIRREKESFHREKDKADVFGLDVVQTGGSLKQNRLVEIQQVLPIPCYPVLIKVT